VGFSFKYLILTLIFGGVIAGAFALHRLQPQAHKTCNYKNWAAPCHTEGWSVDWTDVTAGGVVIVLAIGAGVAGGTREKKQKMKKAAAQSARQPQRPQRAT
jgi:H+/Cl- antiporter ClcA